MTSDIGKTRPVAGFRLIDAMVMIAAIALGCQAACTLYPDGPSMLLDLLVGRATLSSVDWLEVLANAGLYTLPFGATITMGHLVLVATRSADMRRAFWETRSGRAHIISAGATSIIYTALSVIYLIYQYLDSESFTSVYHFSAFILFISPPCLATGFLVALVGRYSNETGWLGRFAKGIAAYWVLVLPFLYYEYISSLY